MIETAIILSIGFTASLLMYTGFKMGEDHTWIKILFVSTGIIFLIGTSFTGYKLALTTSYPEIAGYLIYFVLALIGVFVFYLFYLIWLYIKSTGKVISGKNESFMDETEFG